ncbi:hypothetical protein THAOC_29657, partial [Thalassiosira oceanica]
MVASFLLASADQPTAWADVSIAFKGNVLADTTTFDRARKFLITHVGESTQTGAALGAQAIASMDGGPPCWTTRTSGRHQHQLRGTTSAQRYKLHNLA